MSADVAIFRLLNVDLGWDRLAPLMKGASHLETFIPLIALLVLWMLLRGGRRGRITVVALLVLIPISDQLSSHAVKPWIGRPRPCRAEAGIVGVKTHGARCSGRGSFPSTHAANTGAALILLWLRYRRKIVLAVGIPLVVLIGYSRIYLGLHYPSDILGGWALGGAVALGIAAVAARVEARSKKSSADG